MPAQLVQMLLDLSKTRYSHTLTGLHQFSGDSHRLSVTSNRVLLAFSNAKAVEEGGKYTPPAELMVDSVLVQCGDPDLGEKFDCTRVTALDSQGKRVVPSQYSAGPRTVQNALGVRWIAQQVSAVFSARDVADGFAVTYASGDTEWTFSVSAEDAERELLLKLAPSVAAPDAVAMSKEPVPARLRVRIEPEPSGWKVTNLSGYPWARCDAQIGSRKAKLPTLGGHSAITVEKSQFSPPLEPGDASSPWIVCSVEGTTYIATKSEQQQ